MKDVKTTGRYSNCIIPLGGAVWVKDADNYASIQVHENSKLADLDWLAYDEHGNNITKHIAIDWTGVDTSKSGKTYEILVVCKEVLTNVTIIVVPEKQRLMKLVPANVTMLGTNKTNPRR